VPRIILTEHLQLCCTFDAILAVDIARVITHIVLCVVQKSTSTLHGHGYFTLALVEPVAVQRVSECLPILLTNRTFWQRVFTVFVRKTHRDLVTFTVKTWDAFWCCLAVIIRCTFRSCFRTIYSRNTIRNGGSFGHAVNSGNATRSWGVSGWTVYSRNTTTS
jgi:hypothetical protein